MDNYCTKVSKVEWPSIIDLITKIDKMNHYKISYPYKVTKNGGNLSSFDCFISFFTHHYYNYHLPFNFCLSSCCGLTFNEGFLV